MQWTTLRFTAIIEHTGWNRRMRTCGRCRHVGTEEAAARDQTRPAELREPLHGRRVLRNAKALHARISIRTITVTATSFKTGLVALQALHGDAQQDAHRPLCSGTLRRRSTPRCEAVLGASIDRTKRGASHVARSAP